MNETVDVRRPASAGWIRGGLALISVGALSVGVWALFLPASFYEDFPLPGRGWVSALGPYNEHLVRDVGAMNLAFGMLLALSAGLLDLRLVQVSLAAYLVYTVPHFLFHLTHTRAFSVGDNLAILILLGLLVVLPVAILIHSGLHGRNRREEGQ
ncbi:MAG TPA: hypothetical protein VHM69_04500 [Rubrobacter sp.]|nr:hypothetical protein [Rubrobacter sp.]